MKYAGKDATEAYEPIHPKGTLEEHLPKDKHLGPLAAQDIAEKKERPKTKDELRVEREQRMKPKMVMTWKARPAIMMLEPTLGSSWL